MNRAYASTSSKCMSASCIFFSFASLNVLLLLWCQHMKHTHAYLPIPSHYLCGNTFAGISNSDGKWIASTQCKSSYQYFFVIFPNDANANGSQMMMMILVSDELWLMMMNLLYSKYRMHLQLAIRPCWIESHISYSMLHYTNYSAIRVAGITWQMKLSIHSSVEYEFFFPIKLFRFAA